MIYMKVDDVQYDVVFCEHIIYICVHVFNVDGGYFLCEVYIVFQIFERGSLWNSHSQEGSFYWLNIYISLVYLSSFFFSPVF
jgi:hypothetical protein